MDSAAKSDVHVREYGSALWKRKWLMIIAFVAVIAPVLAYIQWIQVPTYQSSAALMVKIQGQQPRLFQYAQPPTKIEVDTEIEVMKSPPVLAKAASVIEAAGLDPERWLRKVEWVRIEETPVVHITAEAPTPELSRDIANAIGEGYIEYSRRSMLDTSRSALVWLERQLADSRARTQRDEQRLQDFHKTHPDANLEVSAEFGGDYHHALMQEHIEVEFQQAAAQTQLDEYALLLEQCGIPQPVPPGEEPKVIAFESKAKPEQLALLAALSNSRRLAEISAELDAARAALKAKLKKLKPRHPQVLALMEHAATLQNHYEAAFLTECQKGYIDRRARVAGLQALLKEKKQELADYRQQFFLTGNEHTEYAVLQRNVDASWMLYSTVLSKLKEFDLSQGAGLETARFIQPAPPGLLKDPQNSIKMAFAVLCGLLLATGVALLVEYFDTTLKTTDDVERALDLAVLGSVPETSRAARLARAKEADLLVVLD